MTQKKRTWKDNAAEFAALDQGVGWPFAILVACSVEKGSGQGARSDLVVIATKFGKVGAREFATKAGTSTDRVLRYLKAWDRAAEAGEVQASVALTPEDAPNVPVPDIPWREKEGGFYSDRSTSGGQIANVDQIATKAANDPEYARRVLDQVTAANVPAAQASIRASVMREPRIATAADQALEDSHKEFVAKQPIRPEKPHTKRDELAELTSLIVNLRKVKRTLVEVASQVRNLPPEVEDNMKIAIRENVSSIRVVCDIIELGIDGESFDVQLRDLLDAETGR